MLSLQPSWEDCYKILVPDMNPMLMRQLLINRPEFRDEANADEADRNSFQTVSNYLNDQLLDKTKYETSK